MECRGGGVLLQRAKEKRGLRCNLDGGDFARNHGEGARHASRRPRRMRGGPEKTFHAGRKGAEAASKAFHRSKVNSSGGS